MNAPVTTPRTHDALDAEIGFLIGALIGNLFDAQARQRIVNAWLTGWITGDDAMQTLVACDLIEFTPEAADG